MKRNTALLGFLLIGLLAHFSISAAAPGPAAGTPGDEGGITSVTLRNISFQPAGGTFQSDPIPAPFPFNAVVPEWESENEIRFEMRSGTERGWGEWLAIAHNDDFDDEVGEGEVGDMLLVPAADKRHDRVQLRVLSPSPPLASLKLTFIDTAAGPTTEELLAQQAALDAQKGVAADRTGNQANPKPGYISRGVWCTYAECTYNSCMPGDPLKYETVTHLIVHHTVTNNSGSDWAATVRAIFRYHALKSGNCWGDIGYNYLIDMNGVIYEGHRGGDDVIGTHAAGGNRGSMGVSLIGTFTWPSEYAGGIRPPDPMLNSLINLLAWKADQRRINVYEGAFMPDLGSARPTLMGHRDVYGTTTCPGGQAHALLPWVRDQVSGRLPWLVNDHIYIDELSSAFTKSSSLRWDAPRQCGYNTHAYYTWSTNDQNATPYWGEWRFNVPVNGLYDLQVFVPYCNTGRGETRGARYTVFHSGGSSAVTLDQQNRVGRWTSLGAFPLILSSDNRLRLIDITGDNPDGLGVWFDTIRLRRLENYGRVVLQEPAGEAWVAPSSVTFKWDVIDVYNPASMRLRVATDAAMTNIVLDKVYSASTRQVTEAFAVAGDVLYWQVTAVGWTTANSVVGKINLDKIPPTAALGKVFRLPSGQIGVQVIASDDQTGLESVSLQVRPAGGSTWSDVAVNSTRSTILYWPPNPAQIYEFRVSARDRAGNVRGYSASAEASTAGALVLTRVSNFAFVGQR